MLELNTARRYAQLLGPGRAGLGYSYSARLL